jgi:cell division protein FtsZ
MAGVMRVSVVATGIDVTAEQVETPPVPRRPMSRPLARPEAEAEAPAEQPAEPQVADEPYVAPAAVQVAEAAEEPSLFEFEPREEPDAAEFDDDGLPPPAYQPRQPEPRHSDPVAQADQVQEYDPETFVAPQAPAPGTPSPEARARLEQAVRRAPRPAGEAARQVDDAPAERARFGINSLINRMTGHEAAQKAPAPRRQPPVQSAAQNAPYDHDDEADPDQERIEIPAFLRRQAN